MVPSWDLPGLINDLISKKITLTAPQNLIVKLFGQQPVNKEFEIFARIIVSK
jgi:hypothetical protein